MTTDSLQAAAVRLFIGLELVKKGTFPFGISRSKRCIKHILTERFVLFNILQIRNLLIFNSTFYWQSSRSVRNALHDK